MHAKLAEAGYPDAKDEDVMYKITTRLHEMSNMLKKNVGREQRELSRSIIPHIRSCLDPTYKNCSVEKGKGMFQRIKEKVHADIDTLKDSMFCTSVEEITKGLDLLKVIIYNIQNETFIYTFNMWIIQEVHTIHSKFTTDIQGTSHSLEQNSGKV